MWTKVSLNKSSWVSEPGVNLTTVVWSLLLGANSAVNECLRTAPPRPHIHAHAHSGVYLTVKDQTQNLAPCHRLQCRLPVPHPLDPHIRPLEFLPTHLFIPSLTSSILNPADRKILEKASQVMLRISMSQMLPISLKEKAKTLTCPTELVLTQGTSPAPWSDPFKSQTPLPTHTHFFPPCLLPAFPYDLNLTYYRLHFILFIDSFI